jgi:hypothetical protein
MALPSSIREMDNSLDWLTKLHLNSYHGDGRQLDMHIKLCHTEFVRSLFFLGNQSKKNYEKKLTNKKR